MNDTNETVIPDHGYGELENRMIEIFRSSGVPDYRAAEKLIRSGADVNAQGKKTNENVLSAILSDNRDPEETMGIIRFFLDHGFDIDRNNGQFSAQCLYRLVLMPHRQLIDATKLLITPAARGIYFSQEESGNPLSFLVAENQYQRLCEHDFHLANIQEATYQIYMALKKNKPYHGINSYEDAHNKQILKVLSERPKEKKIFYDVILRNNCFARCYYEKLYFVYDGGVLIATPNVEFWTDDHIPDAQMTDVSALFLPIRGASIESIEFGCNSVEWKMSIFTQPITRIHFSNNEVLTFSDSFGEVPDETATAYFYLGQHELKQDDQPHVDMWWK